jgi:Sap, sulfolipid-1-addressing protein
MDLLSKQNIGTVPTVIAVLAFNVIMLLLLEVPLLGYSTRPASTAATVKRFSDLLTRRGGTVALTGAVLIGIWLIVRGVLTLS